MVEDSIRRQMVADNQYFKSLLDLIPTHFYFDNETKQRLRGIDESDDESGDESGRKSSKKHKGLKREGEQSEKAQWKRRRFDPDQTKTVTDIQEELIEAERLEKENSKKAKWKSEDSPVKAGDTEELRDRLHQKISMLQAKRKNMGKADYLQKKKLKRLESKTKLKMKRKAEKQNKVKGHEKGTATQSTPNGKSPASKKPIYNKEGKMVFSKFDFRESNGKEHHSDTLTGKNYKKLLEKVQRQKAKVQKLKETDESKARDFQEKTQWKTVLQKAEGVKVKDNPDLIKQAMKRKEKKKQKSKKEWDERNKKLQDQMKSRQEKRHGNIQKKKQKRTDKKIQKSKKKGHMIPGF